jgi:aminoglycoside phosphotransferase (APT) family kinase protein
MTPPPILDQRAATRLAGLDPALSALGAALPHDAGAQSWVLHDARWTPGQGARLAYRVPARRGSATFVDISVTPTGWTRHDYREDELLPGLATAARAETVAARLGAVLGEPVLHCSVEPVRYRPGLRCVLRYDVRTATRGLTCFAKVLRPHEFDTVAPLVVALAGLPGGRELVPTLTAVWPEGQTIVVGAVNGRSVSSVLRDPGVPASEKTWVAARLGQLLARFHAQDGIAAPSWSAADQLAAIEESVEAARRADGEFAARLRLLTDRLRDGAPARGVEVLAHGAFRAGQVVLGAEGRLVVLDVDGTCRSDPARDLGTALAHLVWQGRCQPAQQGTLTAAGAALLNAYEAQAVPLDGETLSWWRAAGLLQVAVRRFRRLETRDWGRVPALLDAAAELLTDRRQPPRSAAVDLLDVRHMSGVLARALAPTTPGRADAITVESATELASASGRRAVVRYRVRGLDGPTPSLVVGKVFVEPRRAVLLHQHLLLLSSAPVGTAPSVPEPLAHVPDLGLVVYRHREGTPLSTVTDPVRLQAGVRGAARWLACLHSCEVELPRSLSLDTEVASTRAWAALIGRLHPDLAEPAQRLADGWSAGAVANGRAVPLHKDFHPGHVLVGDGLHVIDLDEARQGDPAFDLGHFSAYAALLDRGRPAVLASAFLEEYAAATGWVDRGSLASFRAYAWLKIARQWASGAAPFRAATAARRRAGVEQALAGGLRCLSR